MKGRCHAGHCQTAVVYLDSGYPWRDLVKIFDDNGGCPPPNGSRDEPVTVSHYPPEGEEKGSWPGLTGVMADGAYLRIVRIMHCNGIDEL